MVRGDPSLSMGIFKKMREKVSESNNSVSRSNFSGSVGGIGDIFGGGAANSIRNRNMINNAADVNEVTIEKKRRVDVSLVEEVIIERIESETELERPENVLLELYRLFLYGKLNLYEMSGLRKEKLLEVLDDFREVIEVSVKD